jgi:hypothetical protein
MSNQQVKSLCENIRSYYVDRICDLCEEEKYEDANSLYEEIQEWLIEKTSPKILTLKLANDDNKV